jgi:hypothetical protein
MSSVQFYIPQSKRIAVIGWRKETTKTEGGKLLLVEFKYFRIS